MIPEVCIMRGYMLMFVKPGIVLISLRIHCPSLRRKKSMRDMRYSYDPDAEMPNAVTVLI